MEQLQTLGMEERTTRIHNADLIKHMRSRLLHKMYCVYFHFVKYLLVGLKSYWGSQIPESIPPHK